MNQISALRDALGNVYRRQDYWLLPLFRALTAFVLFMTLRARLGYSDLCAGIPVILAASLFCAFLPWAGIPFLGAALVLGNLYSASLELTLVGGLVFLMAALVQSAFRARGAVLLALMPFFYFLHIPYVLVLAAGLTLGILGFIPLALGTVVYYFLHYAAENVGGLSKTTDMTELANQYADIFSGFLGNREMLLMIVVVSLGFLAVFILRSLPIDYAFLLSLLLGTVLMGGTLVLGGSRMGLGSLTGQLVGLAASLLLGFLYLLLFHNADYRGSEHLQFEDEEYYYYVKAVPKRQSEKKGE